MWNSRNGNRTRERRRAGAGGIVARKLLVLLLLFVAGIMAAGGLLQLASAPGPLNERKVVMIERGASSQRIAHELEREGVIGSRHLMLALLAWQRLMGEGRHLKAGEYAFPPRVSLADVLEILRQGKGVQYRLTIPEGFSNAQALGRVRAHPDLVGELSLRPPEGTLLPDTYLFSRGETRDQLVRRMMRAQERLLRRLWPRRAADLPFETPREAVILASIVEKETAVPEERRRIAAVFVNRLRRGMRLQADPTVIYGITRGLPLGRPISRADLRNPHPWNTYRINGLPPTPIANPGRESIAAVLNPLRTDELYFVADGSGRHLFAADLATHNRNVRRLRAIERKRREKSAAMAKGDDKAAFTTVGNAEDEEMDNEAARPGPRITQLARGRNEMAVAAGVPGTPRRLPMPPLPRPRPARP